jgi:hypothetical protein
LTCVPSSIKLEERVDKQDMFILNRTIPPRIFIIKIANDPQRDELVQLASGAEAMSKINKDKKDPKQRNVTTLTNRAEQVHLLEGSGRALTRDSMHLAVGAVQHPTTRLWQVWVSFHGTDIKYVSAHKARTGADATIQEIKKAAAGDLFDPEKGVQLLDRLSGAGDGEPEALPKEMMVSIAHDIEAKVWKQEQEQRASSNETMPPDAEREEVESVGEQKGEGTHELL